MQTYIIMSMKAIQVLVFLVVTLVITEIIFRHLIPSRERRGFVLVFYALATTCSLFCLSEGIYFSVNPDEFICLFDAYYLPESKK